MSLRNVGIVYRKELREALRDRRTLISTLIVPLILFPLLTAGFAALAITLVGKAKEEVPRIMILGGEDSLQVLDGLRKNDKIVVAPPTFSGGATFCCFTSKGLSAESGTFLAANRSLTTLSLYVLK